jgi:ATP-binding cassette subfamily G (WHITE) protein 2
LLLDKGLDSTTALTVVDALRGIANYKKSTIIVTIHQPSAKIYALFDKCLFLSNGQVTFSGPAEELQQCASDLYKKAGFGAPPIANAPEIFLEICDTLKTNGNLDLAIIDTTLSTQASDSASFDDDMSSINYANNFFYETHIIFKRNLKNILRTKELFFARVGASIGFGLMIGSLFYKRPATAEGVTERVGYLVFALAFFFYTSLESMPIFLQEREIFQREYSRGAYRGLSYVTAVSSVYLPFLLILGTTFIVASWWLVGLPQEAEPVFL